MQRVWLWVPPDLTGFREEDPMAEDFESGMEKSFRQGDSRACVSGVG